MSAERHVGLGLRGQKGGAVVVAVAVENGQPRVVLSRWLATHAEGDRLTLEPYGVAAEMVTAEGEDAAALVAEGRRRQDQLAAQGLKSIVGELSAFGPVVAGLLVNRSGWITDLLSYSLAWAEHVPVAEGLAVREALRFGIKACGIGSVELDEKSLMDVAAERLGMAPAGIEAQLKALGVSAGKPWRKEQKLACLAAWLAIAGW